MSTRPRGGATPGRRSWEGLDTVRSDRGDDGAAYGRMLESLRNLLDTVAGAAPDIPTLADLTTAFDRWSDRLRTVQVDEHHQVWAREIHLPGQGQAMHPPFTIEELRPDEVTGTVVFGGFYHGGGGAVHGGAIPLLFDAALGLLANSGGRTPARTAFLHTDYRSVTPTGRTLRVRGWIDREEGRKRFLRAALSDGDTICAESEALFVELRADQP